MMTIFENKNKNLFTEKGNFLGHQGSRERENKYNFNFGPVLPFPVQINSFTPICFFIFHTNLTQAVQANTIPLLTRLIRLRHTGHCFFILGFLASAGRCGVPSAGKHWKL